ncbi:MAG TPA: UDPGP type 1 family protein [Myxococcota bacterium]|nr:UDPGP type 1 family protein [Myxococcota bacterium]
MADAARGKPAYDEILSRFRAFGQEHALRFWPRLDALQRAALLEQAAAVDLAALARAHVAHRERENARPPKLEAVPVVRATAHGGDPAAERRAFERGGEALAEGRVALLVVAGGQATRLGFAGPKGAFPVGPVSGRSLFEQQAQKIHGLRRRYGRALPWFVMTSDATDAETRALFAARDAFGLPAEDLIFFRQGMVQSLDFEGRLLLERPDRIFENPDGHGGSLTALLASGALDEMERRGIDTIFYYQVDNPLIRIADPSYLGFHLESGAEMSCKVIRKRDAMEKMGVVARADGRIGVIEYTEIDDEHRFAADESGELEFWAGNAAIHVLSTRFVRRVAERADEYLPYHASAKVIPTLDDVGHPMHPAEPNGLKLERFVFDALAAAQSVCVVEGDRRSEYSPIKNAEGADSPLSARRDLVAVYRSWLDAAGIATPAADAAIEIDHSLVDSVDDARALGVERCADAGDAIRVQSKADT